MTLTFRNNSLSESKIDICSLKQAGCYEIEPEQLVIPASTVSTATIYALSVKKGVDVNDKLLISIEDNPQPIFVNLTYQPSGLDVKISPKRILFDGAIVGRVEKRVLHIDNNSLVPINWLFMDTERALDIYTISPHYGFIEGEGSQEVVIEYYSEKEEQIPTCKLALEVCLLSIFLN